MYIVLASSRIDSARRQANTRDDDDDDDDEPNSAESTEITEWTRSESANNDGKLRFSDTGI